MRRGEDLVDFFVGADFVDFFTNCFFARDFLVAVVFFAGLLEADFFGREGAIGHSIWSI